MKLKTRARAPRARAHTRTSAQMLVCCDCISIRRRVGSFVGWFVRWSVHTDTHKLLNIYTHFVSFVFSHIAQ